MLETISAEEARKIFEDNQNGIYRDFCKNLKSSIERNAKNCVSSFPIDNWNELKMHQQEEVAEHLKKKGFDFHISEDLKLWVSI